jgi:hypothetical protein
VGGRPSEKGGESTVEKHAREVADVIRKLQETGEYEDLARAGLDIEGERLAKAWALHVELTDDDVDWLMAHSAELAAPEAGVLEREVVQALARARAAGTSALARRRAEQGWTTDRLAELLLRNLGLDASKREKLHRYYRALEAGVLDVQHVSTRLITALADLLETAPGELIVPADVYAIGLRAPDGSMFAAERNARDAILPLPAPGSPEWDEVDRLFREGS